MNKKSVKMNGIFCENMKIILILLSSMALVLATQENLPPRSVNVALETSFFFDPKDIDDNKSLLINLRGFLDKLYKMLGPQTAEKQFGKKAKPGMHNERRSGDSVEVKEDMTDSKSFMSNIQGFLGKLYKMLGPQKAEKQFRANTNPEIQEDIKLGEYVEVMKNIGQNFLNMTGPKINEALDTLIVGVKNITEPHSVLSQVLPTKDIIKDLDDIKTFINSSVRDDKPLLNTYARRMNTYYDVRDVEKLRKILKKFRRYIDNNKDTTKIVKKLLHNTIFKKYDNLNESDRAAVISDIKLLSEILLAKNSVWKTRRKSPSHDEVDKGGFPEDITYTDLRRSIDEKIRDAREKDDANNEAVVGNV